MTIFLFEGRPLSHQKGESVLDALLRQGIAINYSCKKGVCKGCLCKAGEPTSALYTNPLSESLRDGGFFLPCRTQAYHGLEVWPAKASELLAESTAEQPKEPHQTHSTVKMISEVRREQPWPAPSPDLWNALQQDGDVLKRIIDDFYDAVFEDELLSPYFQKFTKQRSKEKVYSFYKQLFSGEKCYFGDRPYNAHHWMIIPEDIYDHRLALLQHFMAVHGLSAEVQSLWLPYEEHYRQDIVKSQPLGRWIGGTYQPPGGLEYEILGEGCFCDSCGDFIDEGIRVLFETRTGKVYCSNCHSSATGSAAV